MDQDINLNQIDILIIFAIPYGFVKQGLNLQTQFPNTSESPLRRLLMSDTEALIDEAMLQIIEGIYEAGAIIKENDRFRSALDKIVNGNLDRYQIVRLAESVLLSEDE